MKMLNFLIFTLFCVLPTLAVEMTDYCIVGAGPGGLQMGYFMKENHWNYKIFEKENQAGIF